MYDFKLKIALQISPELLKTLSGRKCKVDKAAGKTTFLRALKAMELLCTPNNQLGLFNVILRNSLIDVSQKLREEQRSLCSQNIVDSNSNVKLNVSSKLNTSQRRAVTGRIQMKKPLTKKLMGSIFEFLTRMSGAHPDEIPKL